MVWSFFKSLNYLNLNSLDYSLNEQNSSLMNMVHKIYSKKPKLEVTVTQSCFF